MRLIPIPPGDPLLPRRKRRPRSVARASFRAAGRLLAAAHAHQAWALRRTGWWGRAWRRLLAQGKPAHSRPGTAVRLTVGPLPVLRCDRLRKGHRRTGRADSPPGYPALAQTESDRARRPYFRRALANPPARQCVSTRVLPCESWHRRRPVRAPRARRLSNRPPAIR